MLLESLLLIRAATSWLVWHWPRASNLVYFPSSCRSVTQVCDVCALLTECKLPLPIPLLLCYGSNVSLFELKYAVLCSRFRVRRGSEPTSVEIGSPPCLVPGTEFSVFNYSFYSGHGSNSRSIKLHIFSYILLVMSRHLASICMPQIDLKTAQSTTVSLYYSVKKYP